MALQRFHRAATNCFWEVLDIWLPHSLLTTLAGFEKILKNPGSSDKSSLWQTLSYYNSKLVIFKRALLFTLISVFPPPGPPNRDGGQTYWRCFRYTHQASSAHKVSHLFGLTKNTQIFAQAVSRLHRFPPDKGSLLCFWTWRFESMENGIPNCF